MSTLMIWNDMDWLTLISTLSGAIAGGGVMQFVHWRANARKVSAEAGQAEGTSDSIAIDALNKAIQTLKDDNSVKSALIKDKDDKIEALYNDKIALRNENTSAKLLMCIHLGCSLRKPVQGQGESWFDAHHDDPSLGADYLPINQLLRKAKEILQENEKNEENFKTT